MRKIIGIILIFIICGLFIYIINPQDTKKVEVKETIVKEEKSPQEPLNEVVEEEPIKDYTYSYTARMTSYYPEEGETMTATGLGINDFQVNDKGWFIYNGKLVVATASTRLGYTNMPTYNLYDEIVLNIDGIDIFNAYFQYFGMILGAVLRKIIVAQRIPKATMPKAFPAILAI